MIAYNPALNRLSSKNDTSLCPADAQMVQEKGWGKQVKYI